MIRIEGLVWCDVHSDVHKETTNPSSTPHHYESDGRPVFLEYEDDGSIVESEQECNQVNWFKVWRGAGA